MALSPRMPDLTALETFLAVARHGSISTAAREVGLTQQAVSARIAALEAQTGARLVTRTPRGSQLTAAGQAAAEWSDRLLQLAAEVDAGFASLRGSRRRRVKVCASLTVAEQLFPGWLVSLRETALRLGQQPLDVVLTAANSDHVIDQVHRGQVEVGFIEGSRVPAGLRSRVVAHDDLVLVVAPGHPWARRGRRVDAAELAATPLVTREPGSGTREFLATALHQALGALGASGEPAEPVLELSTAAAIRAAVLAGSAPAVMSRLAVGDDLAAGRLRAVDVHGLALHRALRAVWTGDRTPPAGGVRDLLGHIAAVTRNGASRADR